MKPSLKKVTINRIICKNNAFNNSRNIGFEYSLKMPQCYSYYFLTGNDSGIMVVFLENCDKTEEVGPEISDRLKYSVIIGVGKTST